MRLPLGRDRRNLGRPQALDFTATRRLAVASERAARHAGWCGSAAREFQRRADALADRERAVLANDLDPRAPGTPAWDAEVFRARGHTAGALEHAHEADRFHLVAAAGDRTLGEGERLPA